MKLAFIKICMGMSLMVIPIGAIAGVGGKLQKPAPEIYVGGYGPAITCNECK